MRIHQMAAAVGVLIVAGVASAAPLYFEGFETGVGVWASTTQTASGGGGVTSASGGFHGVKTVGSTYTTWGGYNFGAGNVPTNFQQYVTSIDIYLDVGAGNANDSRVDFSSSINNSSGTFLRDFIFNGGFYNDNSGPGAGTDRFVFSASNNSQPGSAFAKNPGRDPIAISTTGWYTFEHQFYDNGGVLAVDMSIYDAAHSLVHSWTLSDPTDLIGGVGGNRYGWFDYSTLGSVAFDNSLLEIQSVPLPTTAALAMAGLTGIAGVRRRRRFA
jgi:MYXO-CTERM domain-containing protein